MFEYRSLMDKLRLLSRDRNSSGLKVEFKECLEKYKELRNDFDGFPLWDFSHRKDFIEIALEMGIKADIHTLSNAIDLSDEEVVSLLLKNNPELINQDYHSKHESSYVIHTETLTQYTASNLDANIFATLLKHNPDVSLHVLKDKSDSTENILRKNESYYCATKKTKSEYYKARAMLLMLKEYQANKQAK